MGYDVRLTLECEQWLRRLRDPVAKRAVYNRISRVRVGNFGDCEPVGGGVHELRIPVGKGYRVYFTQRGRTVSLLMGGHKGTQKRDIARARAMSQTL